MAKDYGRPPNAAEVRETVEQHLREAAGAAGTRESLTIEWRQKPLHVEVIDIKADLLSYNPGTRRIRAQSSHDPVREQALHADPWGAEAQDYLEFLLKALPADPSKPDPAFAELFESLKAYEQNDPGLITRDGILVNGNTRRAALKEMGKKYIRVGVLPDSCDWADISAVELSLQLRKDHRRDYSYINRLLAIDEQVQLGIPLPEIAREFRTTAPVCEQDCWVLACIRDMIERSGQDGAKLRLVDFEDDQEKFKELRRRYAKEAGADKETAEVIKELRMTAIVLGFSKTDVRLIEGDFKDRYLDKTLPDDLKPTPAAAAAVSIPGLGRTVQGPGVKVAAARSLTDTVLKAKAAEAAGAALPPAQADQAARTVAAVLAAVEEALEPAGKDARLRKRKQAAPDRLADACKDIEQCTSDVVYARGSRSLDEEAFDEAVLKLRAALADLALEAKRSIAEPGDGVAWLLGAIRGED